jgi:hypothetical protein
VSLWLTEGVKVEGTGSVMRCLADEESNERAYDLTHGFGVSRSCKLGTYGS